MSAQPLAIISGGFGWQEMVVLGLLGLLLFGKRLPEVGRSLGKGIVEFKKGLSGVEDELNKASSPQGPSRIDSPKDTPSATVSQGEQTAGEAEAPRTS